MALLMVDSFDHWATATSADFKKWHTMVRVDAGIPTVQTVSKTGPRSIQLGQNSTFNLTYTHSGTFPGDEVFLQFWLYKSTSYPYIVYQDLLSFSNSSWLAQSQLRLYHGDYFAVVTNGSIVAENKDYRLEYGCWHFVQVKWTVTNSTVADDVIVKVDGTEILNPTGIDTQQQSTAALKYVEFKGGNTFQYIYIDDFILMDNQSGVNDGFTSGATFVEARKPNGAGNYSEWTSSGGTNYLMVDDFDADPDENTTYVESGVVGERDSYDFEDISAGSPTILGVAGNIFGIDTTVNGRDLKQFARISSTDYDQTGVFTPNDDTYWKYNQYIWDKSPATATAWTAAEVNGAEFGVELNA
jgi:hypothetical protein